MRSKSYAIGYLKIEPCNDTPVLGNIVRWNVDLQGEFYARVTKIENEEVWINNNYPINHPNYCNNCVNIKHLITLRIFLIDDNQQELGKVSKNIEEEFLSNDIKIGDSVWYEMIVQQLDHTLPNFLKESAQQELEIHHNKI